MRAAIEGDKFLPLDLERHGAEDLRVLENGDIKLHGFLGFVIEPQESSDLLHGFSSSQFVVNTFFNFRPRFISRFQERQLTARIDRNDRKSSPCPWSCRFAWQPRELPWTGRG